MTRVILAAAALAVGLLTAGGAMASQCPTKIEAIDAGLAGNTKMSQEQMDQTKALRDEGEQLHKAGKHAEALATLAKAEMMLSM